MEVILTENELKELCVEWQKRLRLTDWEVVIELSRKSDFVQNTWYGQCSWTLTRKAAHVRVMDVIDYPADNPWDYDMEHTLVHELLHLKFAPFVDIDTDTLLGIVIEQTIDELARVLLELKREGK